MKDDQRKGEGLRSDDGGDGEERREGGKEVKDEFYCPQGKSKPNREGGDEGGGRLDDLL